MENEMLNAIKKYEALLLNYAAVFDEKAVLEKRIKEIAVSLGRGAKGDLFVTVAYTPEKNVVSVDVKALKDAAKSDESLRRFLTEKKRAPYATVRISAKEYQKAKKAREM